MNHVIQLSPNAALSSRQTFFQKLEMAGVMLKEALWHGPLTRVPEPNEVMEEAAAVAGYAESARVLNSMASVTLFHTARISQVLRGAKMVVDLGCGPANQLVQVAKLNPQTHFRGVELSELMLLDAREHVKREGVTNVSFTHGNIKKLDFLSTHSVDAVFSTLTLHHLHDAAELEECFAEIQRVLKPGGTLYLSDFGRVTHESSIEYLVRRYHGIASPHFIRDYECSLRAGFAKAQFAKLVAKYLPQAKVRGTGMIELFVIAHTAMSPLDAEQHTKLASLLAQLPADVITDLKDLRMIFSLGGLTHDPFNGLL